MSVAMPSDFKELVRSRTDIVDLIGEYTALQQKGRDHVGLCRFHDDRNPSMAVSRERQSYKCWSCGEGGDCFSFVQKVEALDFRGALEFLATRAGLEIPTSHRRGPQERDLKTALYEVLAWAEQEFHRCLLQAPQAERARTYLTNRGFGRDTWIKYRLGYHPDDWTWLQQKVAGKFSPPQLAAAKLVVQRPPRTDYSDYFVDRVMFPIRDERGRTVAFGGRVLPDSTKQDAGKYFNSPESPVFAKSRLLYGLDKAREAIRKGGRAVVTEGYTDCITAVEHGIEHVVATLGTALTEMHVATLKRFAQQVVLIYDGDDAGRRAAEKSIQNFLAQDLDLRILTLPDNLDPAEFLAERGAAELNELAGKAPEAWEYKLRALIEKHSVESVSGREAVLTGMLETIATAPGLSGTPREDVILGRLAQRLFVGEQQVRKNLADLRRQKGQKAVSTYTATKPGQPAAKQSDAEPADRYEIIESELIQIIFTDPVWTEVIRNAVAAEEVCNMHYRGILQCCYDMAERGVSPSFEAVLSAVEDADLKRHVVTLDVQAREKNLERVLRFDAAKEGSDVPPFLKQVLERFHWRRREQSHEKSKGQMAAQAVSTSAWDDNVIAALRSADEHHRHRAAKRS